TVDSAGTRWWPVTIDGEDGWVAGDYLDDDPSAVDSSTATASSGDFAKGDLVQVKTDDEKGLTMRAAPSADGKRIAALGNGDVVTVVSGPTTDSAGGSWYKITDGDVDAYVSAAFLVAASSASTPASSASSSSSSGAFAKGDNVQVNTGGSGLAMRDAPSTDGK